MNVIGDIAGEYDTLMALLKKMPDDVPVSVGDMVDRGKKSKEVLDFFMNTGEAIFGNHEHQFVDFLYDGKMYDYALWVLYNGGWETIKSFMDPNEKYCFPASVRLSQLSHMARQRQYIHPHEEMKIHYEVKTFFEAIVDPRYAEWLHDLPAWIENDKYIITHAPINPTLTKDKVLNFEDQYNLFYNSVLWNMGKPRRIKGKTQLYGHISRKKPFEHKDQNGIFAIGLDTSREGVLTGYSTITKEIYQQEFIS